MSTDINNYTAYHQKLAPTLISNHLPWLRNSRKKQLEIFIADGFPTRHQEDWKYTDLSFLNTMQLEWRPAAEAITTEQIKTYQPGVTCYQLVFVDGCFVAALSSSSEDLPQGVDLTSLSSILSEQPDLLQPHLIFDQTVTSRSSLTNLNKGFC